MRERRPCSGYSLVEVLVAMGIFGSLAVAVMTLFYLGRSNVYSGKKMTEGVVAATKVLEDLSGMTRDSINAALKIDDATALVKVSLPSGVQADSIYRSTDVINNDTESNWPNGILTRWKTLLGPVAQPRFANGLIEIVITPTKPADASKKLTTANVLKVRVIVSWNEENRRRRVVLDSVKAQPY